MRHADAMNARAALRVGDRRLPLSWGDAVLSGFSGLAAIYLLLRGRWVPGAWTSIGVYSFLCFGLLAVRALQARYPRVKALGVIGNFWLVPCMILAHFFLEPVVDAFRPTLADANLAAADLRIFGAHPSVVLGALMPRWAVEILLFCYYSYFLWPFFLGIIFFVTKRHEAFNQLMLGVGLFFALNFVGYVFVPAIGPRFFLADEFGGPLQGLWFTPMLDGMMRGPTFLRDCFPSGHTGVTLVTLIIAAKHHRKFFAVMVAPATGLILATIVGRFHYGIDLLCAIPLVFAVLSIANALEPVGATEAAIQARAVARPRLPIRAWQR